MVVVENVSLHLCRSGWVRQAARSRPLIHVEGGLLARGFSVHPEREGEKQLRGGNYAMYPWGIYVAYVRGTNYVSVYN